MMANVRTLGLCLLLVLAVGCKTEREKAEDTLEAYAEAVVVHRAPYNAYVHLHPEDKAHLSVEAYAAEFEKREQSFPPKTRVSVGDVTIKDDRAEASVKITPPDGEPELRRYVLRQDDSKWRVWLGLKTLDEMRGKLDAARRLSEDGAIDEAKEKLEEVAASPFRASRPEIIETEAAELRQRLTERERSVTLDAALTKAMNGDLEAMRTATKELTEKIDKTDENFYPRLVALQEKLRMTEKQAAIEQFAFEDVRARKYRDAWGTLREVRFKTANPTNRPLSKLTVRVDLLNEEGTPPVGAVTYELVENGKSIAPGEAIEVKREIEKAPKEWENKNIAVTVSDLEFADDAKDDEG